MTKALLETYDRVIKQWNSLPENSHTGVSLKDWRNALISQAIFRDEKVWAFYEIGSGKAHYYKTLEAACESVRKKSKFDVSSISAHPDCHRFGTPVALRQGLTEAVRQGLDVTIKISGRECTVRAEYWGDRKIPLEEAITHAEYYMHQGVEPNSIFHCLEYDAPDKMDTAIHECFWIVMITMMYWLHKTGKAVAA